MAIFFVVAALTVGSFAVVVCFVVVVRLVVVVFIVVLVTKVDVDAKLLGSESSLELLSLSSPQAVSVSKADANRAAKILFKLTPSTKELTKYDNSV